MKRNQSPADFVTLKKHFLSLITRMRKCENRGEFISTFTLLYGFWGLGEKLKSHCGKNTNQIQLNMNNPPSYPLRPTNGGPLHLARSKPGKWNYEPKINGWRAIVNTRTGQMWNRHGERLSIEKEFKAVLDSLCSADLPKALTWLDCEALERRHNLGKGSLIVLDYMPASYNKETYLSRQKLIHSHLSSNPLWETWDVEQAIPSKNKLLGFAYTYNEENRISPAAAWERLQALNKDWKAELFEGLVAKRTDSLYPPQRRSATLEFPLWIKHRWKF